MSFMVGSKCVGVCDTGCVEACPVGCIHGPIDTTGSGAEVPDLQAQAKLSGLQLYINPDECIECGACLSECPVEAIYESEQETIDVGEKEYVHKNYNFFDVQIPLKYR